MRKFLLLCCTLLLTAIGASAQYEEAYQAALSTLQSGKNYRVYTEWAGQKYYLNTAGILVGDSEDAGIFTFNAVKQPGTLYETGWNLGCKFTNPTLDGGSTGNVVNSGHINVGSNDRNDWERQVFFMESGTYAVRATNANSANWGANTYWDVFEGETLPEAGYSLEPSYVWRIEESVDPRPEAFSKTRAWAWDIQYLSGLVTDASQYVSNAKDPAEGTYAALLDNDVTTFFHSTWHASNDPGEDHYLQATLADAADKFIFYFNKRSQNNNNRPKVINISASNDGQVFVDITSVTEADGLPTAADNTVPNYISNVIDLGAAYKYVRFTVPETNNMAKTGDHVFFTFSEFYVLPANELTEAALPYMKVANYKEISEAQAAEIEALDQQIQQMKVKKALEKKVAALMAQADKLLAKVEATDTYTDEAGAADKAKAALQEIKAAEYVSDEAIAAADARISEVGKEFFAAITPLEPIDVTDYYIKNPAPMTIDQWQGDAFGTASNGVCEYWNKAAATFHQNLSLPAGRYKLTAVAMTRTGMEGTVYAGKRTTSIATIDNTTVNSRAQAATWFDAGNGVNEVTFTMKEAGNIEIGLVTDANNGDHWTVWRNFALALIPQEKPVAYKVSEAHDYGHWYRADVDNDSIAYSFAFNNTYKSTDEMVQLQITEANTGELRNFVNKDVFVLNEGFRIHTAGLRDTVAFTLTVPHGYEIASYTLDNSIPGAARGLQLYSLDKSMSGAVLLGEDVNSLYDGNEAKKAVITEEVGGTRQCTFYLAPVLPDFGGSAIDVVFTVDVRKVDAEPSASTALKSVKYNGVDVAFDENGKGTINIDGKYDAEQLAVELDDAKATYKVEAVDDTTVKITVTGADSEYDPLNVKVYTIVFAAEESGETPATAIESVATTGKAEAIYDLAGRRVSKAKKGIYIINGKKVLK